jgi:SH3-like domain-containing protein
MIHLVPARHRTRPFLGCIAGLLIAVLLVAVTSLDTARAQLQPDVKTASNSSGQGAGARRYLSLKADRVVLRQGPGPEHPEAWIFRRTGLPVEVVEESEVWRKVRDAGGTEGWVHSSLLSGRRTALVLPWEAKDNQAQPLSAVLRDDHRENARPVVQVEAGVLANIIACGNGWCRVSVGNYRGYIEQSKLWGTYPNEEIKP